MESLGEAGGQSHQALTSAQKDEIIDQWKTQVAIATAQELLSEMTKKCFNKCIIKPGTSIDSSEQKCLAMCMDRYMESWNLVSRTYARRIAAVAQNQ